MDRFDLDASGAGIAGRYCARSRHSLRGRRRGFWRSPPPRAQARASETEQATKHSAVERGFRKVRERPYAPGWLDRLLDWIDHEAGPNWLYALALLVAQSAWVLAVVWWSGSLRQGLDRKSTRLNSSHLGISYAV